MKDIIKNILKESDFDWAESWVNDTPNVGDEYYWDYGMGDGPVLIRVISIINTPGREPNVKFKVMDRNFIDDNPGMFYDEDYGWDPTDSIGFEGFMDMAKRNMNEDLNWVIDVNPLKHGYYYIDARGLSRKERIELQRKLLNLGFRWDDSSSGGPDQVNTWAINTLQGYTISGSKNRIYYSIKPYDGVTKPWLTYLSYDEFLNLINENINENFDWTKNVKPDYWSPEYGPLKVGDCIVDKLDFSSTQWVIEKLGQTLSGTKTIIVSDGEETKILNRESFEKDLVKGRYSFCDDFIKEDFDWVESIDPSDYLVGKCFYFDPPVETDNDSDYGKLFDYLIDNGFEPFYGTERNAYDVVGLYSYIERGSGKKGFVYTSLENDTDTPENYLQHIKDFAYNESVSGSKGIELLYARDYVKSNLHKNLREENEWGGTGRDLNMRGHRDYNKNVYVHRNLNAPPYFSIKKAGGATGSKVIGYDTSIHLKDVKFIVGERGNQEVLPKEFGGEGKAKNVHAGAVGKHVSSGQNYNIDGWELVRYNPRQGHKNFIIAETGEPIYSVKEAILMNEKEVWVKQ